MTKIFAAIAMALSINSSANALSLKDYEKQKHDQNQKFFTKAYLMGLVEGLRVLNNLKDLRDFCLPQDFLLQPDQIDNIIEDQVTSKIANANNKPMDEMVFEINEKYPIELLLVWGLEDTFPCKK